MKTENEKKLRQHEEDMDYIIMKLVTAPIGSELHKRLLLQKKLKQSSIDLFRVRVNEDKNKVRTV